MYWFWLSGGYEPAVPAPRSQYITVSGLLPPPPPPHSPDQHDSGLCFRVLAASHTPRSSQPSWFWAVWALGSDLESLSQAHTHWHYNRWGCSLAYCLVVGHIVTGTFTLLRHVNAFRSQDHCTHVDCCWMHSR